MKALILNNQICQIEKNSFEVAKPLFWVDCPENITTNHTYVDGKFIDPLAPILPTYQELRAAAYPPISDYLDGIVKADLVQQQTYINDCLAVKAKYPKV